MPVHIHCSRDLVATAAWSVLGLLCLCRPVACAETLLSANATYTVRSYAQGYAGQAVPGTGRWIDETGWYEDAVGGRPGHRPRPH